MTDRPQGAPPAYLAKLAPDRWTQPFWDAAGQHRLVCQRCAKCGTFRMPPGAFCSVCQSQEEEWVELSGKATVFSYTVVTHAVQPELAPSIPYSVAIVEFPDAPGVHFTTNIIDTDPESVTVGMPVEVAWDEVSPGVVIPRFRPSA